MTSPATLRDAISADLSWKYDTVTGLAEEVTGPSGTFLALFSHESLVVETGAGVPVSSRVPVLRCRDADALTKGQAVTVRGVAYSVVEVSPDGYGETVLRLHK